VLRREICCLVDYLHCHDCFQKNFKEIDLDYSKTHCELDCESIHHQRKMKVQVEVMKFFFDYE
jgi:hypothetical protein